MLPETWCDILICCSSNFNQDVFRSFTAQKRILDEDRQANADDQKLSEWANESLTVRGKKYFVHCMLSYHETELAPHL